jgi:hypothetical protein
MNNIIWNKGPDFEYSNPITYMLYKEILGEEAIIEDAVSYPSIPLKVTIVANLKLFLEKTGNSLPTELQASNIDWDCYTQELVEDLEAIDDINFNYLTLIRTFNL